jgi:hypothetical protein
VYTRSDVAAGLVASTISSCGTGHRVNRQEHGEIWDWGNIRGVSVPVTGYGHELNFLVRPVLGDGAVGECRSLCRGMTETVD